MKIEGKIRINNKFDGVKPIKDQFEFENCGKYGKGRLTYSSVKKDKEGKYIHTNANKKFICFEDVILQIEKNLHEILEIKGELKAESFKNEKGEITKYDLIVINEVNPLTKKEMPSNNDDSVDDEIPF